MRDCLRCGKEYDETSFLVRLKSTNQTYRSLLCQECVKEDGNAEIIVESLANRKEN